MMKSLGDEKEIGIGGEIHFVYRPEDLQASLGIRGCSAVAS